MAETKALKAYDKPRRHAIERLAVPIALQLLLNEEISGRRRPAQVKALQFVIGLTSEMDTGSDTGDDESTGDEHF